MGERSPLLVLPPRYTTDTQAMSGAAAKSGWQVERLASWRVPKFLLDTGAVIFGEPLFVSVVAGPLGTEMLEPSADWLPKLPTEYLKRPVQLTSVEEARKVTSPTFIKPVADKCFPAKVYSSGAELPPPADLDDRELVLLSEPVRWTIEFRAFILHKQITTMSPYLRNGELAESPDGTWRASADETELARSFLNTLLSDQRVSVPPAVVIDVGIVDGRGWAVVEANAAWGSGLYGCDPEKVLQVVHRSCVPKGKVQEEDQTWRRGQQLTVDPG